MPPETEARLMAHYAEAIGVARVAHEIIAALGGKRRPTSTVFLPAVPPSPRTVP
ncbi:hypothetical protein [Thermodesulfitimonas sp.]